MTRSYFDISDATGLHRNTEGLEFADLEAACREVRLTLPDLARGAMKGDAGCMITIAVRSASGTPLYTAALTMGGVGLST